MSSGMSTRKERKKTPIKTVFSHVMKAKLFGVLTVNALEGIIHEIDEVLPPDTLEEPLDVFSNRFRRYQNGNLMPTSYGDHLDRAAKSLCKDVGSSVTIELFNTQAIKRVISSIILAVDPENRQEMINWLVQPNEVILKSDRYENLINDVCMYYYKESVPNINEDTLSFVRRSANELLRNKASKEALRKKLVQASQTSAAQDMMDPGLQDSNVVSVNDIGQRQYVAEMNGIEQSQLPYVISASITPSMMTVNNESGV